MPSKQTKIEIECDKISLEEEVRQSDLVAIVELDFNNSYYNIPGTSMFFIHDFIKGKAINFERFIQMGFNSQWESSMSFMLFIQKPISIII